VAARSRQALKRPSSPRNGRLRHVSERPQRLGARHSRQFAGVRSQRVACTNRAGPRSQTMSALAI